MTNDLNQPLDLNSALAKVEELGRELERNIGLFSDWTIPFQGIEAIADASVNQIISVTPEKDITTLVDRIKYRRDKLSLTSSVRDKIVSICQQILTFGAAGVALSVGFIDKAKQLSPMTQKIFAIVGIFYSELIVLSLIVLMWYLLQARFRYPYLYFQKIGNAWPFFYYATVTQVQRSPIQTPRHRFKSAVSYAQDFVKFADLVVNETPRTQLRSELQQYFLLLSYQGYAHQFSLRLANIFMYGFSGAVLTLLVMFALLARGIV